MWEADVHELVAVVDLWERANPDAGSDLYCNGWNGTPVGWDEPWRRAFRDHVRAAHKCCGQTVRAYDDCEKCGNRWYEMQPVELGPRGEDTYDTVLWGASGNYIAAAAYCTKGQPRTTPRPGTASDFRALFGR
jgi:hypothetical protein